LVLSLTILGLLGVLTIILLWDRILGQKIADHAHGVVGRFLTNQNSRMGTTRKYAGLLLDLNRCYFEFQHFSAARVEEFAKDFSVLLRKFFPGEILKAGDKNSVIVYFAQSIRLSERLLSELRAALRELLKEYGALDNEEETLESMVLTLSGQTRVVADEISSTREAA